MLASPQRPERRTSPMSRATAARREGDRVRYRIGIRRRVVIEGTVSGSSPRGGGSTRDPMTPHVKAADRFLLHQVSGCFGSLS